MALLRSLFAPSAAADPRGVRAATINSPTVPLSAPNILEFIGATSTSSAGVAVTEKKSLGLTAVWRAVNLISSTCAGLPLHVYTDGPGGAPARAESALLDDPHPDLTPFDLWEQVFTHLCLWGNAYLLKLRNGAGQVVELWPIHPSRVRTDRDDMKLKRYVVDGDEDKPYDDRRILHIPGFGDDGTVGLSVIQVARNAVGLGLAAEDFGGRLFQNGSLATGILTTDQKLEEDQARGLKRRWREKAQGLDNAHEAVVLDRGTKFQQLTIPPEDAQFIESRGFQVAEVARMFGIPPWMLADVEKSTSWGTGIEQQMIGAVVFTFRPWLIRVEQRVRKHLLVRPQYAKYSVEGLLRGDTESRYRSYTTAIQNGILSRNEVRALEERPPVPGGDAFLIPANMLVAPTGEPVPVEPEPTDAAEQQLTAAEVVQKVYLGVGSVLTPDEARQLINEAGADLPVPGPFPANTTPAPAGGPDA